MRTSNPEPIWPVFEVVAWILIGIVGFAMAVFALFFGGLPGLVAFLLLLAIGGGLWWWEASEMKDREDGGRQERPGDR